MEQVFNFNNEHTSKIALVTGGTKGAGIAIADRLLQARATVIITARNKQSEDNSQLQFIPADLSTKDGSKKVIQEIIATFGSLIFLSIIWVTSDNPNGGFELLTDEEWLSPHTGKPAGTREAS